MNDYLGSDSVTPESLSEAAEPAMIDNETFHKGIRENGTVEGYFIETYYRPCKGVGDDEGFLRVQIDDDATDLETRIPHSALIAAGWVKAPSTVTNRPEADPK